MNRVDPKWATAAWRVVSDLYPGDFLVREGEFYEVVSVKTEKKNLTFDAWVELKDYPYTPQYAGTDHVFATGMFRDEPTLTDPPEPQIPMNEISRTPRQLVRKNALDTSWEAALSITPAKRQRLYRVLYTLLTMKPLTDDELLKLFIHFNEPHSPSGLRARRSELVAAGWVRPSGEKRPSNLGNPSTVWEAVPEQLS